MKKIVIAAAALGLSLTACGNQAENRPVAQETLDAGRGIAQCQEGYDKILLEWKDIVGAAEYDKEKASFVEDCKLHPRASIKALAETFEQQTEGGGETGPTYDKSQVVSWLHLEVAPDYDPSDNVYVFTSATGDQKCEVGDVYTSKNDVEMEDPSYMAVTPEGNVGVVVFDDELATCKRLVSDALTHFESEMGGE